MLADRVEVPATLVLLALEVVGAREGLDGRVCSTQQERSVCRESASEAGRRSHPWTPYFSHSALPDAVQSTSAMTTFWESANSSASLSQSGFIDLQWPHQGARNFTKADLPASALSQLSSVSSSAPCAVATAPTATSSRSAAISPRGRLKASSKLSKSPSAVYLPAPTYLAYLLTYYCKRRCVTVFACYSSSSSVRLLARDQNNISFGILCVPCTESFWDLARADPIQLECDFCIFDPRRIDDRGAYTVQAPQHSVRPREESVHSARRRPAGSPRRSAAREAARQNMAKRYSE